MDVVSAAQTVFDVTDQSRGTRWVETNASDRVGLGAVESVL